MKMMKTCMWIITGVALIGSGVELLKNFVKESL